MAEERITYRTENKISGYAVALISFAAALFLDQTTKVLAAAHLKGQPSYVLIKGVFELRYLENRGAAFGMLQDKQFIFIIGALLISAFILFFYRRIPPVSKYVPLRICAVLLCAGAIGNVIDRIRLDYVIDFFYFSLIDFPVFNVADCYVVTACILFILLILFYYKDEDFTFLRKKKCSNQ